jgi:uncharacterized protein
MSRALRAAVASAAVLAATLPCSRPLSAQADPTVPIARGFVSDYVGVLDPATVRGLEALIGELKAKTGAEIAVVVVKTTQPLNAFDYAIKIAEAWKPGDKSKDNGVVFLVAIEDRELHILTGYGVEGPLPDGRVGEIRDRLVVPAFRAGDYAGGIRAATEEMAAIIAADAGVTLTGVAVPRRRESRPQGSAVLLAVVVLVVVVLLALQSVQRVDPRFRRARRRRYWSHGYDGGFGGGFGGGGFGGGGGGGFGGFGGGGFGGGGAGGKW